jgi:hypothetical protein
VIADTIVTTVGVVIVAWIGYRQEAVRRELARFNGTTHDHLQEISDRLPPTGDEPPHDQI